MNKGKKIMIKIREIKLRNFRAYKEENIISIGEEQLILLTGENGYGKTSLIDAIEWCITGDIKRLHSSFDDRAPAAGEKNKIINKKSILKNKECNKTDEVHVSLKLNCDGEEVEIFRTRIEDTLDVLEEFQIIQKDVSTDITKQLESLKQYQGNLYQNCFLDMGKAYRFMNMPRTNMREHIKDFMEDTSEGLSLVEEITRSTEQVQKKIDLYENQIKELNSKKEIIKEKSDLIVVLKEIPEYPIEKAYLSEETLIVSTEKARELQQNIRGWGFEQAEKLCKKLVTNQIATKDYKALIELTEIYEQKREQIDSCIDKSWYLTEKRNEPINGINRCNKLLNSLGKEFTIEDTDLESFEDLRIRYYNDKKEFEECEKEIKMLDDNISSFGKGTKLIELFRSIIETKRELIDDYIDTGHTTCPLCGSTEQLLGIDENTLGKEAEEYLNGQERVVNETVKQRNAKKQKAMDIWNLFKDYANTEVVKHRDEFQLQKVTIEEIWSNSKTFFDKIEILKMVISDRIIDNINSKLDDCKSNIINDEEINGNKEHLISLLAYLGKEEKELIEREEYKSLSMKLEQFYEKRNDYITFNQNVMIQKLAFLEAYLSSNEKAILDSQLKALDKEIGKKSEEMQEHIEKRRRLISLSSNIEQAVINLENCEIDKIGPYIESIFSKIIKHANIKEFHFTADRSGKLNRAGVSLQDEKQNNVLNMLSDGQMSVFMVAYFIGNLLQRSDKHLFASYFIDDVTSFLDDINMLSFLDVLKYIMAYSENAIKQLFFCTCNKNVEELMKNRMEGFGIGYTKIEFIAVGKPRIIKSILNNGI
jgi:DNA repair protein SbcC/Rad50